jgi:hypothetical protein
MGKANGEGLVKRMTLEIPEGIWWKLSKRVKPRLRSAFIIEAIKEKLER